MCSKFIDRTFPFSPRMSTITKTVQVNDPGAIQKELATLAELAKLQLGENAQTALYERMKLLKAAYDVPTAHMIGC